MTRSPERTPAGRAQTSGPAVATLSASASPLALAAAGLLALGAAEAARAADTLIAGGEFFAGSGDAIDDLSAVTIAPDGTPFLGASETIGSLAGTREVQLDIFRLTTGGNDASTTFSGPIRGFRGEFAKIDAGVQTVSGANRYTGPTLIEGGALRAEGGGAIGDSSDVTIAAGATLELGADETIGLLEGAGAVDLGASTLTVTTRDRGSSTFSGVTSGAGGLTKTGPGFLRLTGDNPFTGFTTIDRGGINIGDGRTTGAIAGDIVNRGTVAFSRADDVTYGGVISGTGASSRRDRAPCG